MGKGIVKLGEGNWAVKDGNLLAAKETNGRFKNAEFTVTRGTDATYVGKDGLIANETGDNTPRIDFTENTDGHLLLEPQSTNLIPYSEDFEQSNWINSNISEEVSTVLSPNGETYSYKLTNNAVTGNHFLRDTITVTNGQTYTLSVFIKKGTKDIVSIADGYNINVLANFDLTNGTRTNVYATSSNIESYNNGWYKCSATLTTSSTYLGLMIFSGTTYAGTDESGYFYVWGAQVEALPYATSYIPTNGSTVTRDAETCTGAGEAADFNSEEGVLYAEIAALANDGTWREINLDDGSTNNAVEIRYKTTANQFQFVVRNGGTAVVAPTVTISNPTEFMKVAFSYKTDDCKMYINGVEVATDTSGTMPSGLNHLSFDWGGTNPFRGKCKAIRVYKEALSDSELVTLTS